VYNWRCHHSCDVERLDVGIASRSVFGLPLRDKFLLDRWKTGFHPSWSSLCRLGICSGTNLRLRRLVPIFYGIFELAGAQTQETEKLVIFWLQKK
jgi:hypothetical protein